MNLIPKFLRKTPPKPQADTSPERVRRSLMLRFAPIRNLTPEKLSSDLDNFRLGFFRNAALMWDAMERRDDRLQSVAPKRKKSVARHGWEILTTEDTPEAQAQKECLEAFYNSISATTALEPDEQGGMSLLIRQMMDAVGKRYAVHEIIWTPTPDGLTAQFVFCPLWWFEGRSGKLRYLANETMVDGADMEPNGWLVTVGDGLMEACSVAYMFKHLPLRDWLNFSEKFGMPGLLGETTAQQGSPEWDAMVAAVQNFGNDWAAVINAGSKINLVEAGKTGEGPWKPLVDGMNEAMTVIWRGGNLGTMSKADSIGASLQESETDILDQDDAQMIGETLTNQVSRFVLQYNFGDAPQLAYLKIRTAEPKNVDADLRIDTFLLAAGAPLAIQATMERYNRPMPADGEELLKAPAAPAVGPVPSPGDPEGKPSPTDIANIAAFDKAATSDYVKALQTDLAPVVDRLNAIMQITDPVLAERAFNDWLKEFEKLKKNLLLHNQSTEALQKIIATSFAQGLSTKTKRA